MTQLLESKADPLASANSTVNDVMLVPQALCSMRVSDLPSCGGERLPRRAEAAAAYRRWLFSTAQPQRQSNGPQCAHSPIDIDMMYSQTPLLSAAQVNAVECARLLLERKANPLDADADGRTALMHSAQGGFGKEKRQHDCLQLLVAAGCPIDTQDREGKVRCPVSLRACVCDKRCFRPLWCTPSRRRQVC